MIPRENRRQGNPIRVAKTVPCPVCPAAVGANCPAAPGAIHGYHAERLEAAKQGRKLVGKESKPKPTGEPLDWDAVMPQIIDECAAYKRGKQNGTIVEELPEPMEGDRVVRCDECGVLFESKKKHRIICGPKCTAARKRRKDHVRYGGASIRKELAVRVTQP